MKYKELLEAISIKSKQPPHKVDAVLKGLADVLFQQLSLEDKVLTPLGHFYKITQKGKAYRPPGAGTVITTPDKIVIKFKSRDKYKMLKD